MTTDPMQIVLDEDVPQWGRPRTGRTTTLYNGTLHLNGIPQWSRLGNGRMTPRFTRVLRILQWGRPNPAG
jgi:hypothetical protein